ncbi:MAG: hypothetical protein KY433_09335, partial [Actinobacteria bacterium]|nr:hypothetical protein [Actinomycetota bacterium]
MSSWAATAPRRPPVDLIARTAFAIAACIARRCAPAFGEARLRAPRGRSGCGAGGEGSITLAQYPCREGENQIFGPGAAPLERAGTWLIAGMAR